MLSPRDLAQPHSAFDGAVMFYILPFIPARMRVLSRQLNDLYAPTDQDLTHATVVQMEGCLIDVEIHDADEDALSPAAKQFIYYWQQHNHDLKHDVELMQQFASDELLNEFWRVWEGALDGVLTALRAQREAVNGDGEETDADPGEADADAQ